ncbi:MAG: protoporphyrinogen/coproporphyrinogen oxidase [Actinomycetota bacterium]|jgi:oxygen-dependent protoporphyrinogen oxidase|nr:protoporphyrinogen/coproporphyrinogen oxidase [Actinomycetota bacterium]
MSAVVVIGGGITGLAAAHALVTQRTGVEVTLLERAPRVGGKILTERHDGITYEAGPDAFVARDPAIMQLCTDLELRDSLIPPSVFGAHIWSGGKMKALPPDWSFGLPTGAASLLGSDLLPVASRLRALWDLILPGKLQGEDISVGDLVRRRVGGQLLERVVDPLLAGSRAGNADDISVGAAMPQLDAIARSSSSLIRGLGGARKDSTLPEGPPPFLGIPGGMQHLVDALAGSLTGATVRTGAGAASIEPSPTSGYSVHLEDGARVRAQGVIIATPAYAAAALLESLDPEAARQLYRIQYASSAVAVLVYPGSNDKVPPTGSGFLVPSRDHKVLSACTWYSKKWPAAAAAAGRLVLRCFVGRSGRDASLALDDGNLISLIDGEIKEALGITEKLEGWKLYRWDRGLPHYRVGHRQLVEKVDAALAAHRGIAVAGAGYRGSGLPDCVRQGQEAALRIVDLLADADG